MIKFKYTCLLIAILAGLGSPAYGQMYKWVDEKGTAHFADDLSKIPERYRKDVEIRKVPKEAPPSETREKPAVLFNNSKGEAPFRRRYRSKFHANQSTDGKRIRACR